MVTQKKEPLRYNPFESRFYCGECSHEWLGTRDDDECPECIKGE